MGYSTLMPGGPLNYVWPCPSAHSLLESSSPSEERQRSFTGLQIPCDFKFMILPLFSLHPAPACLFYLFYSFLSFPNFFLFPGAHPRSDSFILPSILCLSKPFLISQPLACMVSSLKCNVPKRTMTAWTQRLSKTVFYLLKDFLVLLPLNC